MILSEEDIPAIPLITELNQNFPNPFNPSTNISFAVASESYVRIDIYNIRGQRIATLLDEEMPTGYHNIIWHGIDDNDRKVSSGVYFFRMIADDFVSVRRMILLK